MSARRLRDTSSLAPFLAPRSVAIVGASRDPAKVGGSVLANLQAGGFAGRIVPVNREGGLVQGLPACTSLLEVVDPIDVAVIAVPAPEVLGALEQCAARGIPGAVVISAGFREAGVEGREREAKLRAWLRGQPLRLLGPNCLGWMRPVRRLNLSFAPGMPPLGNLGFFSHSGALCTAILDWARERDVGFSLFASLGNQADIDETDVLALLAEDHETRVILGYVEGVADGRRFFDALRVAATRKPCVLMKAGRSPEGARAVSSHTGALAGSDRAFDAAVKQAGAVRASSLEEMFDLALALADQPLPRDRRVLLVTNGGGLGVLGTDAARAVGLEVAPLSAATVERLRRVIAAHAAPANPVDLIGDATAARYSDALEALHGEAAACIVMLTPQAATDAAAVARSVLASTRTWDVPVLTVFAGGARVRPGALVLEEGGIPCYPFPERAVRTLAGMVKLAERTHQRERTRATPHVDGTSVRRLMDAVRLGHGEQLGYLEICPLLTAAGIPTLPAALAHSPSEASGMARSIGMPVALKIVSPDITHKSDLGGVELGLMNEDAVAAAAAAMFARVGAARPDARLEGVLVQRMAAGPASELLLGMVRDPQFGPLIVVGFGGVYVEILNDTSARLAPLDPDEARAMVEELRMAPALKGARGMPPTDLDALADVICRFAQLALVAPELAELEINPLRASARGVEAVDARGRLSIPMEPTEGA
jgi:acetyltransferase